NGAKRYGRRCWKETGISGVKIGLMMGIKGRNGMKIGGRRMGSLKGWMMYWGRIWKKDCVCWWRS
ncbi:hypothetical protein, partial [Bacillus sp. WP8]|uniref:hypothetical protein n=1 Tax=Bacillus sp. WP8 TaxID=756828 RepID=UPI001C930E59